MGCGSQPALKSGKAAVAEEASDKRTSRFRRGNGAGMSAQEIDRNTGDPQGCRERKRQQALREEPAWPWGKSERPIVAWKPGNAGGAKGPQFHASAGSGKNCRGPAILGCTFDN